MKIPKEIINQIPDSKVTQDINQRIEKFKTYLIDENNTLDLIIDRYLLFGTPYLFEDNEDSYFSLKAEIADFFKIKQTQVYIVGSAKLGFSISPNKRFKHFDEESDIDVAVIDSGLFLQYWRKLYKEITDPSLLARSTNEEKAFIEFKNYFFKGWLRPDKFPMKYRTEWFDFFSGITRKYDYHVAAGIYRDYEFFSSYNAYNLLNLRNLLKEEHFRNDE